LTVVSVRYQRIFLLSLDNETPEVLVSHLVVTNDTSNQSPEDRILDAARRCVERWGINKLTIDDVATEANVSRATLYRIFPGGKDVMFDALRVRELNEFFAGMRSSIEPVESLLDFAVKVSVYAIREMRNDEHLAMMLSTEEGTALKSLTVEGLPRILNVASQYMTPFLTEFVQNEEAEIIVELLARFVISFFLAPSQHFDLGDPDSARSFFAPFIYAFHPAVI
jgi:AcrR family transcriptional regulator